MRTLTNCAIPELAASLGMREGELYGLGEEDLDLDEQKILRVRRQVKRIGRDFVFALPKNDSERIIPLSNWDIQVFKRHIARYPPRPYTLPEPEKDKRGRARYVTTRREGIPSSAITSLA